MQPSEWTQRKENSHEFYPQSRLCRWIAGGADTVEYVIVAIVAVIIGAALIAFGNQMQQQMTKTGNSISSWFESARNAANTSINGVGK